MEEQEEFDFEEAYNELRKQYSLPEYEALAQDFEVEKTVEKETAFLAREIRRRVNEKISAYLQLIETLINPSAPPMFIFKVLKSISPAEKQKMQDFYKILSKTQIRTVKLDTVYSEKNEAEFINETFEMWQKMKPEIYNLFESFESNFENGSASKERSYFD